MTNDINEKSLPNSAFEDRTHPEKIENPDHAKAYIRAIIESPNDEKTSQVLAAGLRRSLQFIASAERMRRPKPTPSAILIEIALGMKREVDEEFSDFFVGEYGEED